MPVESACYHVQISKAQRMYKEARVVLSGLVQEEVGKLVADVEGLVASSS